jgi:translocation and assembly module TamB
MNAATPPVVRRRWPRVALWVGAGVVLVPLLLLSAVLWWASSEGSLARALRLAQRWLPAEQQLAYQDVTGSVSGGGHIGRLQWSKHGTTLTVEDLRLEWSLRQLLGHELQVRTLSIRRVHVRKTTQPDKPDEPPFKMPAEVSLPIRITVPLTITHIEIESGNAVGNASVWALGSIDARYRYDGEQHLLRLTSLHYGQSQLQASAQLHAKTLALAAQVDASLRNLVPDTPFAMQAKFTASGSLAGGDAAQLAVALDARQQDVAAAEAARIQAQATVHPWRTQPAQQVDLQLANVNAHAFHAQAPVTDARGSATVQPAGAGLMAWNAVVEFTNDRPGAWDRQRLPLHQLTARSRMSLQQVDIETARAELGMRAGDGTVSLSGQVSLQEPNRSALQLTLGQLNLRNLLSTLPRTSFTGPVSLEPLQQDSQRIEADIRNALPGPLDRDQVPLDWFLADLRLQPAQWHIQTFDLRIGAGSAQLRGDYAPRTGVMNLRGELQHLPLRQIHRKLASDVAARLSGNLAVAGKLDQRLTFDAKLASDAGEAATTAQRSAWEIRALEARGAWTPTRLTLEHLHADAFQATADGSGIDLSLPDLDTIKAQLTATAPGMKLTADAAMLQQSGGGRVSLQLESAETVESWLRGLPFVGEHMPALHADGAGSLTADWQGNWRQWLAGIENPASQPRLHLNALAHTDGLRIDLPETATQSAIRVDVRKLDLDVQGNLAAATLNIDGEAHANDMQALLDVRMQTTQAGGTGGAPRWNIATQKFTAAVSLQQQAEPWRLQLSDDLQFIVQTGDELELRATAGGATLTAPTSTGATEPLQVAWQPMTWRRNARGAMTLQSTGTVTGIQPAWLDTLLARQGEGPLAAAGMRTDLVLRGEWDARMTDRVSLRAHLQRDSGDLALVDSGTSAGMRAFDLTVQAADENVSAEVNWDTENAGVITASVATRFTREAGGWSLPADSPLSGSIKAKLQDLSSWAFLVPPGWRIQGELDADVRLAGTVGKPQLNGGLEGRALNIRSVLDGVDLHEGTLRASLRGSGMQIEELVFQGGTGSRAYVRGFSGNRTPPPKERGRMVVSGSIDWGKVEDASAAETGIVMDLKAKLESMQVLVRHDRQMTLSGNLAAGLDEGQLRVRGDLVVNRASIVLPEASAPKLGDDVVIVRSADLRNPSAAEARTRGDLDTRKPMDMEIELDLGRDLAVEGEGLNTRLEGALTVRSASIGSNPFVVFGEVRTVEGRYRAWGQALNIETGVVRFNGPPSNPTLELLAIRPQIEVRAGVHVTGTLLSPRIQLYSEPELPEGEKLSWVVLGRATVVTGAEGTSMQQAALSLAAGQLSGKLASGLGVDELGLTDSGVSIGKRISNELYLTYQQGLAGAASTLFIFYDITRRLTVRAQASEASAMDLIYTIKYD